MTIDDLINLLNDPEVDLSKYADEIHDLYINRPEVNLSEEEIIERNQKLTEAIAKIYK